MYKSSLLYLFLLATFVVGLTTSKPAPILDGVFPIVDDVSGIYMNDLSNLTLYCNADDLSITGTFTSNAGYADGKHVIAGRASQCALPATFGFCISSRHGSACWVAAQNVPYLFESTRIMERTTSAPWETTVISKVLFSRID